MKTFKSLFLAGGGLLALGMSTSAVAQNAAGAAAGDNVGIADIVVTANKREESLNKTGVTAAVIGGEALQLRQMNSLADIAQNTPGLAFANAPTGTPVYTLRGVGLYELAIGSYPTVSVYLDQAPLPFPVMANHATYDLERVEVLKGPQGLLFGQNSTGGAINYIVAKPTDTFTAGGTVTYGRFNTLNGDAFVSGPITDKLAVRVAGRVETADPWQYSTSRPGEKNGKVRNYMGRVLLSFNPTESLRFLLNVNGWIDKSDTLAGQHIALQFQNEGLSDPPGLYRNPEVVAAPFTPHKPRAADWSPNSAFFNRDVPFADNHQWNASLRTDLDVGDIGTLTSITSYTSFKERQGNDTDGLPFHEQDAPLTKGYIKSFSQELRFANDPASALRFVVGANYSRDKTLEDRFVDYSSSSATIAFGALFGFPLGYNEVKLRQKIRNYAFFGNLEYDITDALTIKGGARYTNSRNKGRNCQLDPVAPYNYGGLVTLFSNGLGGLNQGPYQPGQCAMMNIDTETGQAAVDYLPLYALGEYIDTLKEDNVSWKIGADYKITPDILAYFAVSKGYKAGGFPVVSGSTMGQDLPARQESLLDYEGGIKASLLDRRLQINLAGFYYDYRDKQLLTKINDNTFGIIDAIRNIPKSSIKGFEAEVTARPVRPLTLSAAYTYMDAQIDRYIGTNAGGDKGVDFAGTHIPFTPKHQFSVSADVEAPFRPGVDFFGGISANYRSGTISTLGGNVNPSTINRTSVDCVYCISGYTLVDARMGFKSSDQRWTAYVWGKNIFNKYYWTNTASGYDTVSRFPGTPATYGVTLGFKFQ